MGLEGSEKFGFEQLVLLTIIWWCSTCATTLGNTHAWLLEPPGSTEGAPINSHRVQLLQLDNPWTTLKSSKTTIGPIRLPNFGDWGVSKKTNHGFNRSLVAHISLLRTAEHGPQDARLLLWAARAGKCQSASFVPQAHQLH